MRISQEVKQALENGKAVVALESTIISHGMPYPKNFETAIEVEAEIRKYGAVPATIAIIRGEPVVGCSKQEIEYLAQQGTKVIKVSRRDVAIVVSKGLDGATTVAATMLFANLAGINIFATGGIGGVHRGAETTMDISADLEELAQTDVTVVCAGAKSILDLGLTLEYLETKGVPVIGYGTNDLPAFFTRKSGFSVNYRLDSPDEIAEMLFQKQKLKLLGGVLITNPIPTEYSMDEAVIEQAICNSLAEAKENNIKGKALTPFLLKRINELTKGKSLESNIQLVLNNARLAALIATSLSKK